jgi:porphobilinogen synthase
VSFPLHRPRRLRRSETIRRLVRETRLSPDHLIAPLFVCTGDGVRREIASMPGCFQLSPDLIVDEARELAALGVPGVILFGIPDRKDPDGYGAADPEGPVPVALKALKRELPDFSLWADVCLCEYTDHGHCGPIVMGPDGRADVGNDAALPRLADAALAYTRAGADVVAPSDMMDGRVGAIRSALDAAGREDVVIVSYAAKYASAFYGPFREAAGSAPAFGDRRSYQMDPANAREALSEVAADLDEGADIVMVKPALSYLDVIWRVKERFNVPVAAYNVSGEFAMVKAAGQLGWLDEGRAAMEILLSIRRAGADIILTYFAKDIARVLNGDRRT